MFGKAITIFKMFGFAVRVDASWIIIALLVTWSLAAGEFPNSEPGLEAGIYWAMGATAALGLFVSIILHELTHSLVARRYGLQIKGITLFVFGGVSEMQDEPRSPGAELMVAVVGPLSSVVLAAAFVGLWLVGEQVEWPVAVNAVTKWLGYINGLLAVFNMLPAFPLDGGRVLRSALWGARGNLRWATRVASAIGSGFGILLMVLGGLMVFMNPANLIGGIWLFVIGMFLRGSARMSYQQLLVRQALEGEPVNRFMSPEVVSVPPGTTLRDLVENYIYKYHFKMLPVVEDGRLLGCVTTREVGQVPREAWGQKTVQDIVTSCGVDNAIAPGADAMKAMSKMARNKSSRLMVVDGDRLVGMLTLKDLMAFLSLKIELGDEDKGEQ